MRLQLLICITTAIMISCNNEPKLVKSSPLSNNPNEVKTDSLQNEKSYTVESDYQVKEFVDSNGWVFYAIINQNKITLMQYPNKNEYHTSGSPYVIVQGEIGKPDKENLKLGD